MRRKIEKDDVVEILEKEINYINEVVADYKERILKNRESVSKCEKELTSLALRKIHIEHAIAKLQI